MFLEGLVWRRKGQGLDSVIGVALDFELPAV